MEIKQIVVPLLFILSLPFLQFINRYFFSTSKPLSKPLLGYWDIRGLAQPIRNMLAYAGVDFDDKYYSVGPPPNYDNSSWVDVKFTLGFEFPNLPYYIDGNVKITQSQAIINYIARQYGLDGKTEEEKIRIDILNGVLGDVFMPFVFLIYQDYGMKEAFLKTLPDKLKAFSNYLGSRRWFAGENISYIDFKLYEFLFEMSKFSDGCLDEFDNLKKFVSNFEDLPAISKYLKSPTYIHKPFNNKMAKWTGA